VSNEIGRGGQDFLKTLDQRELPGLLRIFEGVNEEQFRLVTDFHSQQLLWQLKRCEDE
jgi:hypothetical protein